MLVWEGSAVLGAWFSLATRCAVQRCQHLHMRTKHQCLKSRGTRLPVEVAQRDVPNQRHSRCEQQHLYSPHLHEPAETVSPASTLFPHAG